MKIVLEDYTDTCNTQALFFKEVDSIEEAKRLFISIRDNNNWGASNYQFFESGFVSNKNNKVIAKISYNGRIWDVEDKDLHDYKSWNEVLDSDTFDNRFFSKSCIETAIEA